MQTKLIIAGLLALFLVSPAAWSATEHEAEGTIDAIDKENRTLKITHGPIKSMGMSGMTMNFKVADPSMLMDLAPGQKIDFVLTTNSAGEFLIVDLE